LSRIVESRLVSGTRIVSQEFMEEGTKVCDVCVLSKQAQNPHHTTESKSTDVLDLIHMDVCGPIQVPSLGGARYFATFLDDYSRISLVKPVDSKADVLSVVKEMIVFLGMQNHKRVKQFVVIEVNMSTKC
jgi:hypothetical protein